MICDYEMLFYVSFYVVKRIGLKIIFSWYFLIKKMYLIYEMKGNVMII